MIQNIEKDELDFMELLYTPEATAEVLFSNYDNLSSMEEEKIAHLRTGQLPLISYEYCLDENPKLSVKQNFQMKKGSGDLYCLGGRLFGKTLFVEKIDLLLRMVLSEDVKVGFSSYDLLHIRGVLEDVIATVEHHPVFRLFSPQVNRSPNYRIALSNGFLLESVNMNITGKKPGSSFWQKHFDVLYIEEASLETEQVYRQRRDSVSENGCVLKGTKILLSDFSTKNIEDVQIGDEILAWDEKNSTFTKSQVLNAFFSGIKDVVKISNEGGLDGLWLTQDHQMLVKSPGLSKYRWAECIRCTTTHYDARLVPFINDKLSYKFGLLLGLIAADGHIARGKNKSGSEYTQYSISQSTEVDFLEQLLADLNIKYAKDIATAPFSKRPIFNYRLYRDINIILSEKHTKLNDDKDMQYGFISGFIIGDGWVNKNTGNLHITQSIKKTEQLELLSKVLNKLNLPFQHAYISSKHISGVNCKSIIYTINRWSIPFYGAKSIKVKKWIDLITTKAKSRVYVPYQKLFLKGFQEKQPVYDLTTKHGNFIANGFIVHNCIYRIAGMTNFTKYSPCGRVFYDLSKKAQVLNLPQYVNPRWDFREKEKAVKDFGGEQSLGFRVFIKGEVVEAGVSVFDMQRVRYNYNDNKVVKNFEISKEHFLAFDNILIVERPKNAEEVHIFADVGETAPSEIGVIFKINEKYRYVYNITLYGLTDKEQFKIFKWLGEKLSANYISLDCTDGLGRAIFRSLAEVFPKDNLVWVSFNEKLPVDFVKDDKGNVVFKDGAPVHKEEYVSEWSVKCLKDILYGNKIELPLDYKFDKQLNQVIAMQSGTRVTYECVAEENHLFQAFQVFAIAHWLVEFRLTKSIQKRDFYKSGV